jgi:U3 small nucleolar RNA-associated protein 24
VRIFRKKEEKKEKKKYEKNKKSKLDGRELHRVEKERTELFFSYNSSLGPPYHIIIDTNFINFSIQNKLDILKSMIDALLGKCTIF